jgi:signal transduction histidine kinase
MTLVVLNLVDNAIKYAVDGGEVEVSLQRSPGGVMLGVRDNGPGIAADEQRRIFERFYRARGAREANVRGSGIGLSLVKYIAEAHGGRVTVESPVSPVQAGRHPGTAFRVYLPAPVAQGSESSERHEVHAKLTALRQVGRS